MHNGAHFVFEMLVNVEHLIETLPNYVGERDL